VTSDHFEMILRPASTWARAQKTQ